MERVFQSQQGWDGLFTGALECEDGFLLPLAGQHDAISRFGPIEFVEQIAGLGRVL
jgi:hypothetical protein